MTPADDGVADMPDRVGRYRVLRHVASGGYATLYLGRIEAEGGFARAVAIKRLHPHLASDAKVVRAFLDEARIAARIRHPNVVSVVDVIDEGGQIYLVMDFVRGEPLSDLVARAGRPVPPLIAVRIAGDLLRGLHAAHEARDERGARLEVIHRDVSPQNILIGLDGAARVVDFGIAKSVGRSQETGDGPVKGKLRYMAPEQVRAEAVDRRVDVYAAAVVLWEMLTGRPMFDGEPAAVLYEVLAGRRIAPSAVEASVPALLDDAIIRALSSDPRGRHATALDFAKALEERVAPAAIDDVAAWARAMPESEAASEQRLLDELLAEIEATTPFERPRLQGLAEPRPSAPAETPAPVLNRGAAGRRQSWFRWGVAPVAVAAVLGAVTVLRVANTKNRIAPIEPVEPPQVESSVIRTHESPVVVDASPRGCVDAIYSGVDADSTCAVRRDGKVYCWGDNQWGVLREGGPKIITTPVLLEGAESPSRMVLTRSFAFAIVRGELVGWGTELDGVLGMDREGERGRLALKLSGVESVSARGNEPSVCVVQRGKALCWGSSKAGEDNLDLATAYSAKPVAIPLPFDSAATVEHVGLGTVCATSSTSAWSCWGNAQPWLEELSFSRKVPSDPSRGFDKKYTVIRPDRRSGADRIAGSGGGGCLLHGGAIRCWGSNKLCQVHADVTSPVVELAEERPFPAALARDVRALAAGDAHFCAIASNGRAYCWGSTEFGQAGEAGKADARACDPVEVPTDRGVKMLALGSRHSCALTDAGEVRCFGANGRGQLGRGKTFASDVAPAPVPIDCGN